MLGALIDAGADINELKSQLALLGISEYELITQKVVKYGLSATDVEVDIKHHHHEEHNHHHGRTYTEIAEIIKSSGLNDRTKERAISIFTRLGVAEAKIHNCTIDEIHFHEVGAVDAIVDIVGTCICMELLDIDKVYCGYIPTFYGTVKCAHGTIPLPAPATAELLKGAKWKTVGIEGELVTPTGAAIASALSENFGKMPSMTIKSIGYGSGKKDFGMPNLLRVIIGETDDCSCKYMPEVTVIETNIDDLNPQIYEVVMERLLKAGALDVYITPIQMKKNRPAILLTVLSKEETVKELCNIVFEETSTIGIRLDKKKRICMPREFVAVSTKYGEIKIKVIKQDNKIINAQPEYEDCKSAAAKHSVPVKMVHDAAVTEYWKISE